MKDLLILFRVYKCSACVDVDAPYVCLVPAEVRGLDPLKLEFYLVVSCPVSSGPPLDRQMLSAAEASL